MAAESGLMMPAERHPRERRHGLGRSTQGVVTFRSKQVEVYAQQADGFTTPNPSAEVVLAVLPFRIGELGITAIPNEVFVRGSPGVN